MVWTLLASEPACSSVRAKAASFSPLARGGSQRCLLLGRAEQDEGPHADRMVGVDEHRRRGAMAADHFHDPAVAHLREAPAAPLLRARPSPARPDQPARRSRSAGMSASRSIAAASMWVSANSRTAATASSTAGRWLSGSSG